MAEFHIERVVTKDIITDSFQGLRNFFGLRLGGYESVFSIVPLGGRFIAMKLKQFIKELA